MSGSSLEADVGITCKVPTQSCQTRGASSGTRMGLASHPSSVFILDIGSAKGCGVVSVSCSYSGCGSHDSPHARLTARHPPSPALGYINADSPVLRDFSHGLLDLSSARRWAWDHAPVD